MTPEPWPALPYEAWKDTYSTLHMWVGSFARSERMAKWNEALRIEERLAPAPGLPAQRCSGTPGPELGAQNRVLSTPIRPRPS